MDSYVAYLRVAKVEDVPAGATSTWVRGSKTVLVALYIRRKYGLVLRR